jgi:hypothetical protein
MMTMMTIFSLPFGTPRTLYPDGGVIPNAFTKNA